MHHASRIIFGCVLLTLVAPFSDPIHSTVAWSAESSTDDVGGEQKPISFHQDISPIFSRHCYGCHQGAKQLGSYVMTEFQSLLSGGESEQSAIVPGKPDESYLVELITPVD